MKGKQMNVMVDIKEIYKLLCPNCKEALLKLVSSEVARQQVEQQIRELLES